MEYIINYKNNHSCGSFLYRKIVRTEPQCGDIIFVKGAYYRIVGVKYDYEVWQSVGIKVFDVVVDQIQDQLYDFNYSVINDKTISVLGVNGKCPKEVFIPSHINVNGNILPITFVSWITLNESESCEILHLPDTIEEFEIMDEDYIKEVFLGNACRLKNFDFPNCANLERVTLPSHIDKIPCGAFRNCPKLHNVITENEKLEFYPSTFIGCKKLNKDLPFLKKNYVIENGLLLNRSMDTVYTYLGCDGEGEDFTKIVLPQTVRYIGDGFSDTNITSIDLSQTSIIEIEDDTFSSCYNLKKIFLPNNLKRIGDRAFSSCENLKEIIFPPTLEELGIACFIETGLKTIELPCLLKNIPKSAFANCKELEWVSIPYTVKFINLSAFKGCTAIRHVDISIDFKNNVSILFDNIESIQFVYNTTNNVPPNVANINIYTNGSLICPYCGGGKCENIL